MDTILANEWIPLSETRKGATVQRKYAGLDTLCDENNKVLYTIVKYWERELYPNGETSKIFIKSYTLTDLERQEWIDTPAVLDEEGNEVTPAVIKYRNELLVLSGFVASLGNNYIIAPTRATIANLAVLPLDKEDNYPLHRDTRAINTV
jgi:hypothetical protein